MLLFLFRSNRSDSDSTTCCNNTTTKRKQTRKKSNQRDQNKAMQAIKWNTINHIDTDTDNDNTTTTTRGRDLVFSFLLSPIWFWVAKRRRLWGEKMDKMDARNQIGLMFDSSVDVSGLVSFRCIYLLVVEITIDTKSKSNNASALFGPRMAWHWVNCHCDNCDRGIHKKKIFFHCLGPCMVLQFQLLLFYFIVIATRRRSNKYM